MSETMTGSDFFEVMGISDNELAQVENKPEGPRRIQPGISELARSCGEEGIVLLENDGTLPFQKEQVVSVFGRVQQDYFYVGYGSGGDVHAPYEVGLHEGLSSAGIKVNEDLHHIYEVWCKEHPANHGVWGKWPYFHPEMPIDEQTVTDAATKSDVSLIVIGRAAGEDRENQLKPGSFYLTDIERDMIEKVCRHFTRTVLLLDIGNIIDFSFIKEYPFSAVVLGWQLGMESGNAVARVLSGAVNPSGKLTDTIAYQYADYPSSDYFGDIDANAYAEDIYIGYRYFETFAPEKVQYPFGYGLSYTTFAITPEEFAFAGEDAKINEGESDAADASQAAGVGDFADASQATGVGNPADATAIIDTNDSYEVRVKVTNTGKCAGKEVVQLYLNPPTGKLSKSARVLVAFAKTKELAPGESETLTLTFSEKEMASYDDCGVTGYEASFVLEAGEYQFYVGDSIRDVQLCGTLTIEETTLVESCTSACAVQQEFEVLNQDGTYRPVYRSGRDLRARILDNLPEEIVQTGDGNFTLYDVKDGKASLEEFIAQLSDEELSDLSHGEGGMGISLGTPGNAGGFGGITPELRAKGVPILITSDGPSGLRLRRYTSLLPCGTALACTWNTDLVQSLYAVEGEEAVYHKVDVLLAPGMNLHRNPLCGRNFEYYAEDPLLSGRMATAVVKGLQSAGVSACPKHFACNQQEVNRNKNDSRVSERALRELYLRNFEIVVKEARPENIMTSYNKVNGVWSHYNYDLVTTVLREEWGYEGNVMTDWWMQHGVSPEFPILTDSAYRVRAGVDVLMPGSWGFEETDYELDTNLISTLDQPDGLTRAELQRTAFHVLRFALTRL